MVILVEPTTTMTPRHIILPTNRLLRLTDIHLDKATTSAKSRFLGALRASPCDAVLITGDISVAADLIDHLTEISKACGKRPVIFTTGNHDYFGSSFKEVDQAIASLCARHRNLIALGNGEVIQLSNNTGMVGHPGWYDGQSGAGEQTKVESPDRYQIHDFIDLDRKAFFKKLRLLGQESAKYFRKVLPQALSYYSKVILATHVPPFTQGIRYSQMGCVWNRQPYFANRAAGNLIWGISKSFPNRRIQIYAGHTHSAASVMMRPNLSMHVAGARPGCPPRGELLTIA